MPRLNRRFRAASIVAGVVAGAALIVAVSTGSAQPPDGSTRGEQPPPPQRLAAAGIREVSGRHLQLLTDASPAAAIDELPAVYDAAIPLWAEYFDVEPKATLAARRQACLVVDRQKFAALDLLPPENRDFLNGYANARRLWLVEQPSDYYRRHLLLHEGTHAFMLAELGSCGPGWYMEGMAELLATHQWADGKLRLGVFPASRDLVPMWGRVKLIRDAFAAEQAWPLARVLAIDSSRVIPTEEYAWAWALCTLLDGHPQFQAKFRSLNAHVRDPQFNERFRKLIGDDWGDLAAEWEATVALLDYGYDVPRMAMTHRAAAPIEELSAAQRTVRVAADRGWQSTGWLLRAGRTYRVTAAGRYQIALDPQDGVPWPCEPGGVTIDYFNGRPLGMLLGALRPVEGGVLGGGAAPGQSPGLREGSFGRPLAVGLEATITPPADAVLYLRMNDSPAKLGDNVGECRATVAVADPAHQ